MGAAGNTRQSPPRTILLVSPHRGTNPLGRVLKRPSTASIALALLPFFGMCFSVPLWDRLAPRVLGLPFNMFWLLAWLVLTPALMSVAYRIEKKR
jgi:hypothetical protein